MDRDLDANGDRPVDGRDGDARLPLDFASMNTAAVTELCIRTMREIRGLPVRARRRRLRLDRRSLEMLQRFEQRVVAPRGRARGRRHPDWLDGWLATCPTRYAVFCDSDIEFLRPNFLRKMVERPQKDGATLVATRIQARGGVPYQHPVSGARRILAERPEPWLMLIDSSRRGRRQDELRVPRRAATRRPDQGRVRHRRRVLP